MFLAIIVMIAVFLILNNRGYEMERMIPIVLLSGAIAYFIPFGAIIAWPFKLIGGAISFFVGALSTLAGGIGGLIGGVISIVVGGIGLVLGIVGSIIGLVFGIIGGLIGLVFAILIPALIIWFVFKLVS